MVRSHRFPRTKVVLLLSGCLLALGAAAGRPAGEPGRAHVAAADDEPDPGLPGSPADDSVLTNRYVAGLEWGEGMWWWKKYDDEDIPCDHARPAATTRLRIQPEKRVHHLAESHLAAGNGRFVARITNRDDTEGCNDWKLPPGGVAYLWMGRGTTGNDLVSRLYVKTAAGEYKARAEGGFMHCADGGHGKAHAKWNKKACAVPPGFIFTHNSGWVSCFGGCCSAQSLGLIPG